MQKTSFGTAWGGVNENKIIKGSVLGMPGFDFDKYIKIKEEKLTIFCNNCWGGITYHSLNLPFLSPFINMALNTSDWIKFLEKPDLYLDSELTYKCEGWATVQKRNYPIGQLRDIELHFNHYFSFEEACIAWEKRKQRINMRNLFVMTFTYNANLAKRFDELPYKNKVCFVPWESDLRSCQYLKCLRQGGGLENMALHEFINGCAHEICHAYNIFDMLIGKTIMRAEYL